MKKRVLLVILLLVVLAGLICFMWFKNKHEHSYTETVIAPTCTEGGYTLHKCSCGDEYTDHATQALGHDYGEWVSNGNGAHTKTCANDPSHTITENCSGGSGACGETVICEACGAAYRVDHIYTDKVDSRYLKSEADCESAAAYYKSCFKCGAQGEETFEYGEPLGHNYTETVIAPTCTEGGYTLHKCSCGDEYTDHATQALGHDYGEWVSNGNGAHTKTCANDPSHKVTENCSGGTATCYAKAVCEICGEQYGRLVDHNYENGVCVWCGECEKAEEATGLKYVLSDDGTYYIVSGIGTETRAAFAVPSTYNDKPVKAIGEKAFEYNSSLTSIELPDSVTSIGSRAFYECTSLTSIEIPDSVTSIGDYAFYECTSLTSIEIPDSVTSIGGYMFYGCSGLTNVTIGKSVTSIGGYAFYECTSLTSIEIPDSVTSIGGYMFSGCSGLTSVEIPDIVTSIGDGAFYGCTGLTSIELPDSVTSIGDYAFDDCTSLTSVMIGKSVTSIGIEAFSGCDNLQYTVYGNAKYLGNEENPYFALITVVSTDYTSYTIHGKTKIIAGDAFFRCKQLTSIVIPDGVTTIGGRAFYECSSLTNIEIPDSVTSIDDSLVFYNCDNLQYTIYGIAKYLGNEKNPYVALIGVASAGYIMATIHENTKVIAASAFKNCTSLEGIKIPDGVTSIGNNAFYNCYSLRKIVIPDSVTSIGYEAFQYCSSLKSVTFGENSALTSIGRRAFDGCSSLTSIEIPDSVTSIGDDAFDGCYRLVEVYNRSSLTIEAGSSGNGLVGYYALNVYTDSEGGSKLTEDENGYVIYTEGEEKILVGYHGTKKDLALPSGITTIYDRAFYKCISLTSIEIPDSVTSIGREVFSYCRSLTSIVVSESVASIAYRTFFDCCNLTSVTIGNGVASIGKDAFYNCSSLTSIEIPDSVTSIGSYAFSGCSSLTEMTIPFVGENKDGTGQTYFGYIFGASVPNSLKKVTITSATSIDESAFYECASLTSVVISDSVTSIGDDAFNCCSGLTSVMIGNGVTSIGNYAFFGCTSLTSVTIGNSVSSIGGYAFFLCTSLTSIELPDSVTSIGDAAFYCCSSLRSVTFGENSALTSIGGSAFSGCSSLTSIEIPAGVTSIGNYAFCYCSSLTNVAIGDSVMSIGVGAFYGCTGLETIKYNGTVDRWNAIGKDSDWDSDTGNYTVVCTDGTLSK